MSKNTQANVQYASGREAALARRKALSQAGKGAQTMKTSASQVTVQASASTNAVHGMVCTETPCLMTSQVNGRELALAHRRAASTHGKAAGRSSSSPTSAAAALRKEQAMARKGASAMKTVSTSPLSHAAALRKEQALARKAAAAVTTTPVAAAPAAAPAALFAGASGAASAPIVPVQAKVPARRPSASTSAEALRKERALARKAAAQQVSTAVQPAVAQVAPAAVVSTVQVQDAPRVAAVVTPAPRVNARQLRQEAVARKQQASGGRSAAAMRQQRREQAAQPAVQLVNPECGCPVSPSFASAPATVQAAVSAAINPIALQPSGRAFAMARRTAMSSKGKTGAGVVKAAATLVGRGLITSEAVGEVLTNGLNGRQIAMARRAQLSSGGARGKSSSSSRPSGKTRKAVMKGEAVVKVEESETLKGQHITGTIPDRSKKVTGNEPGSLRAITGTEYVGAEQYDNFGAKRPQPNPDKVVKTETSYGKSVTGGNLFPDQDVTGAEAGACRKVTGTEYIAADVFKSICGVKPEPHPQKVLGVSTPKNKQVSGMPIVRSDKVTGVEVGAERAITGTAYLGIQDRATQRTPALFQKVGQSHTLTANQEVTGTMVGHGDKMTGDEAGACFPVSGSQYLSMETFKSYCREVPYTPPAKTGRTMTASGQEVTGVMVGRKPTVTGDEAGSCREITGDQYFSVGEFGKLCTQSYPRKVAVDETTQHMKLTGTAVDQNQRVTGGEAGGCAKVSGTQYVSPQTYREFCQSEAPAQPRKVGEAATLGGQRVTGPLMGRGGNVTGNEPGACATVTGTGYVGFDQIGSFCGADELAEVAARAVKRRIGAGHAMTGQQPAIGGVMTGDRRGSCQVLSGTPYVGVDQFAEVCGTDLGGESVSGGFSVAAPHHASRGRITGTAYGEGSQRITGPSNKATGRVSGTPEFRYAGIETAALSVPAAAEDESAPVAPARERITGEGRQAGRAITGDDWQRSSRITGTEGLSAHSRNLTLKGDLRQPRATGALANRDIERPEAPTSRITGSAGVTVKGPVVTLSGGARG
jgi:hypothetical protein